MRIAYVAKHGSGGNDDEGAIAHALQQLGHEVLALPETTTFVPEADLLLFHKWTDAEAVRTFRGRKAFWYFDLVDWPDPTLKTRCDSRKLWMSRMMPLVDVGFCTDGDWALQHSLVWLPQGADERVVGRGEAETSVDVLFVGNPAGGTARLSFHKHMIECFGERYKCIKRGVHGRDLANAIAGAKVVVAPDAPVTHRYWSNRVYLMLGFGACLLHKHALVLAAQYKDYRDLAFYYDRSSVQRQVESLLRCPSTRAWLSSNGLEQTVASHLYRHRCSQMLEVLHERTNL